MPMYEYYCRTCNETFTKRRPRAAAAAESSRCVAGHRAMKLITTAAVLNAVGEGAGEGPAPTAAGCACGRGSCGCGSLN